MIHPENLFNFIVKVQNLLFREFTNVIVSPFALEALFLGILSGADGSCFKELANCLFGQDVNSNDISEMVRAFKVVIEQIGAIQNADFKMNNFIYISDKFEVRPSYCSFNSKNLNIQIKQLNFEDESLEAYTRIDTDIRTASVGRINKILKCLPTVSRLMLVSQVSFQSELKYKPVKQYDGKFKATNQDDASTKFTVLRNQFKLNEKNPDFVYVELPYVTEGMNLCIVLPSEESSLRELVSNFKYEQSMQLTTLSVFSQVEVHLPVLKVQSNVDLAMVLQLCGISQVFEKESADFSKVVNNPKGLFLESVVTNTELMLQDTPKPCSQLEAENVSSPSLCSKVVVNRPFMYSVTYNCKNLQTITLFNGVVNVIE